MAKVIRALGLMFLTLLSTFASAAVFPSSSARAQGTWDVMARNPFRGTVSKGCALMGVSSADCAAFEAMRASGNCIAMDVPNGVVLDRLIFGEDQVQNNVRVALTSAPTRAAQVCGVNGNAIIGFHGCNNLALVRGWRPPVVSIAGRPPAQQRQRPVFPGGSCQLGTERFIALSVYAEGTRTHSCAQQHMLPLGGRMQGAVGNGLEPDRFSRSCGAQLHGSASLGTMNHGVTVVIVEGDQEWVVSRGAYVGRTYTPTAEYASTVVNGFIRIPDTYTTGNVELRFDDYSKVLTPTPSGIIMEVVKLNRGCRVTVLSAIEGANTAAVAAEGAGPHSSGGDEEDGR